MLKINRSELIYYIISLLLLDNVLMLQLLSTQHSKSIYISKLIDNYVWRFNIKSFAKNREEKF